jgi:hypothetical protein
VEAVTRRPHWWRTYGKEAMAGESRQQEKLRVEEVSEERCYDR